MKKIAVVHLIVALTFILGCKNGKAPELKNQSSNEQQDILLNKGKNIASATFTALSGELSKAVKEGGLEHALSYCNVNALPLTDSLANANQVEIRRTSLKYRNPKNQPTPQEESILLKYEAAMKNDEMLQALVVNEKAGQTFYAPIIAQAACLKCHGAKTTISVYDKILNLYPNDLATGYQQGDLRGMWSIKFKQ